MACSGRETCIRASDPPSHVRLRIFPGESPAVTACSAEAWLLGPQSQVGDRCTWHQTLTRRPVSPRLHRGPPRPRHTPLSTDQLPFSCRVGEGSSWLLPDSFQLPEACSLSSSPTAPSRRVPLTKTNPSRLRHGSVGGTGSRWAFFRLLCLCLSLWDR